MSKKFNQYKIEVEGSDVEISRFMPSNPKSHSPLIIAPGWTATYPLIQHVLHDLTSLNRPIYAIIHPRTQNYPKPPSGFDKYQMAYANNILGAIEDLDLTNIDLIAHSSGAIHSSLAAHKQPEHFRSLTLVNPSGFNPGTKLFRFYRRSIHKAWDDTTQTLIAGNRDKQTFKYHYSQGRKYMMSNPIHTLKELHGINSASITPLMKEIRMHGIYITVVAGDRDVVFPLKEMVVNAKPFVDSFRVVNNGWHDAILFHPKRYTKLLEDILHQIELAAKYS